MKKKSISCEWIPKAKGTDKQSQLYKYLTITRGIQRPLANYIYASYTCSDMASKMDAAGMTSRDINGEHKGADVLKMIEFNRMQNELMHINDLEKDPEYGFTDSSGNRINYTDAEEALRRAEKFNDEVKGLVANVYKYGDNIYNIIAFKRDSKTHTKALSVQKRLRAWEIYKQVFNALGIDIDSLTFPNEIAGTFSAYNIDLVNTLDTLQRCDERYIYRIDALKLFCLYANSPQVQALVGAGAFGSLEEAAQAVDDIHKGRTSGYTPHQRTLINTAITFCRKFKHVDPSRREVLNIAKLKTQIERETQHIVDSNPEEDIRKEIHRLNKKYGIDLDDIVKVNDKIKTLSDALIEAAFVLKRRIRELEKAKGSTEESRKVEESLNVLMIELNAKRFCAGIMGYLQEASNALDEINKIKVEPEPTGSNLEKFLARADKQRRKQKLLDEYYPVISALTNEKLIIDESISSTDLNNLRTEAAKLKKMFEKEDSLLIGDSAPIMFDLMQEIVGDDAIDGIPIANAVYMGAADATFRDRFFYSMGDSSNPMISAIGSIIEDAQDERRKILDKFDTRITTATKKLHTAGHDTKFMYGEDGYIISNINWIAYNKARRIKINSLKREKLSKHEFDRKLAEWEDENLEDRPVDVQGTTVVRTEKVPNAKYRKPFPKLTAAQLEYYNTMMQIKGELGTMMPEQYRFQYRPPQKRRNFVDALSQARSLRDVIKAIWLKLSDPFVVREDDENYRENGIIDGTEVEFVESAFDSTPLRQIPIFYVKKLKDQGELLKEFSSGLQHLAGTVVNYYCMNKVVNAVEFMSEYTKGLKTIDKRVKADAITSDTIRVVKMLKSFSGATNTQAILDGFIAWHIYGQKRDPSQSKIAFELSSALIKYTSFKSLSTNIKGWINNALVAQFQCMIEAGAGEFYNFKNYAHAMWKMFGTAGEVWDILTERKNSKATLLAKKFDPMLSAYTDMAHKRYHKSVFRKIFSLDISFLGYGIGEFWARHVNMYAMLDAHRVLLNGKSVALDEAYEKVELGNGVAELVLKPGVTNLDGSPFNQNEFEQETADVIKYCNITTQGSNNEENKGLMHQYILGCMAANLRQWMVGHYSRRYRRAHFNSTLGKKYGKREGMWNTMYSWMKTERTEQLQEEHKPALVMLSMMADFLTFTLGLKFIWNTGVLSAKQKANARRVLGEMIGFIFLIGLNFGIGDPDKYRGNWLIRMLIYQIRRIISEISSGIPTPLAVFDILKMINSPIPGTNTLKGIFYAISIGLINGDLFKEVQKGKYAGESVYWKNLNKYSFPFVKDIDEITTLMEDDDIYKVFNLDFWR